MPAHAEPVSSGLSKSKKNLLTVIVPSYTGVLTHIYSPSPPAGTTLSEMPSAMALLDAQVRQLASNRDNTSGSQATETPPTQWAGTENSQNAVSEAAEGQTTSLASLLDMVLSSPVEQGRPANPGTSSLVSLGEGPLEKWWKRFRLGIMWISQICRRPKAKPDPFPRTGKGTY